MIPVIQPYVFGDLTIPRKINLINKKDKFFWKITHKNVIPIIKTQVYKVDIEHHNLNDYIKNETSKYLFIHIFINLLVYNNLDLGHVLKFTFTKNVDKFVFIYFIDENEQITLPSICNIDNIIKIMICIEQNRPCLKISVRDSRGLN